MLTLANVNTKQAKTYYKRENYYSQSEAEANSQWQGQGAEKYNLRGAIDDLKAYENVVDGLSPDSRTQLRQKQNHKNKFERAGVDLTFSAPKSVSIACLVGGDKRLVEAHKRAVSRTIDLIESRYAETRINGQRVKTGNLIVAKWEHDTSRELDPHLHTHCVVMNCTQSPDGKWRSLSNKAFYRNKILLGQIYRNELALECRKLGYEIEFHPKELFEIKGYTREQIEAFSKRHEQIKDKLAQIGVEATTENKVWAWRQTRAKKNHEITQQEKLHYWHEEADLYGIVHPLLAKESQARNSRINKIPEPSRHIERNNNTTRGDNQGSGILFLSTSPIPIQENEFGVQSIVSTAIEHCSEKKVAFTEEEILKFVTAQIQPYGIDELELAIKQHPELIQTFDERYTTQAAVSREIATLNLMQQGKGQIKPIASAEAVEDYLQAEMLRLAKEGKRLTQGQTEAVKLAATTDEQFIAVCGVAGAGKTHILQLLKTIAEAQDYTVHGFAPSGSATKVLGKELGIKTNTVASLLLKKQPLQIQPKQLWIIDEAGLLNAKDGYKLLKRAHTEQAQVILVGDYRQNSAVEAGSPFRSLLSAGISTAQMNESLRQKTPQLKKAADLAATGNNAAALNCLLVAQKVESCPKLEERTSTIAAEYLKLTPDERCQTLVLAGTHKEKGEIMQMIRSGLMAEGLLSPDEISTTKLRQRQDLTTVQTRYTHNYRSGDVVMPIREYKRLGLHKFVPYTVAAIRGDKLLLNDQEGNQHLVDPMQFRKQVYTQHEMPLAVGDRLKWTQGSRELGHTNGDEFVITGLAGHEATIEYDDGKIESLNLAQPLNLDYAIVSTTYSSQGKTADRAIISSTVDQTVNQESIYVAITRTRYDLKIFAEDIDFLMAQAQESNVQQNPLELLEQKVSNSSPVEAIATTATTLVATPTVNSAATPTKTSSPQSKPTPQSKPKLKPKLVEPFFSPTTAGEPPSHIDEKHWRELVEGSAIDPDLVELNIDSVAGRGVYERLLSTKLEQIGGSGQYVTQPAAKLMKAYELVALGGWWAEAGIDARSLPQIEAGEKPRQKLWGCFKADNPRIDADKSQRKGKTEHIKYEHPLAEERQLFLFNVPEKLAERIYDKYGIQPTAAEKLSGFWYIVHHYNLPIKLAEGAKKTLSSLSQGEITIGLSGVNGGYFAKGKDKERLSERVLHPELKVFATPGREFTFTFDHDTKESTIWNVRRELVRIGELLEKEGSSVRVAQWQGDKGLDDLIVNQGARSYADALSKSIPLARDAQKHYRGNYSRLSRRVRDSQPSLSSAAIDIEVYKLALLKGDNRDGARTIAQSDTARLFKSTLPEPAAGEKTLSYIQQIENSVFRHGRQPHLDNSIGNAADAVAPKNLNPEERIEQLQDNSVGQQPEIAHSISQTNELNYGINTQEFNPRLAAERSSQHGRDGLADREDHAVRSEPPETNGENQLPREQQHAVGRENHPDGIESDRKPERVEDESQQLLAATSGYPEQQEAEQDGAAVEGINRSLTERRLPSRVAAELPRAPERQDSTSPDSTASNVRVEQQTRTAQPPATGECLNAISGYAEAVSVESALLSPSLQVLANNLLHYQSPDLTRAMQGLETAISHYLLQSSNNTEHTQTYQQAIEAIALYLTAEVVETGLVQNLEGLAKQLSNQTVPELAPSSHTQAHEQLIEAIALYLTAEVIKTGLVQNLEGLTKQLSNQIAPSLTPPSTQTYQQIVEAIAGYTEVEAFVTQSLLHLSSLTQQLSQLPDQSIDRSALQLPIEHRQTDSLFIETITGYIEQQSVEGNSVTQALESLAQLLKQPPEPDKQTSQQIVEAIANYVEVDFVWSNVTQSLESLSQQISQLSEEQLVTLLQQLEVLVAANPERTGLTAANPEQSEFQPSSLFDTIGNFVETATAESFLTPPLIALIEQIKELPDQSVDADQLSNQTIDAISLAVEFEAVAADEIVSALSSLKAQLSTSPSPQLDERIDLSLQNNEPVLDAIANYVSNSAISAQPIAQAIGELSQQLGQQDNPLSSNQSLELLTRAASSSLQRLEATIASLQQKNTLQFVEALSSFALASAVESTITPQTLQALTTQLQGLQHPELATQMQQLEAVVKDVETQLKSRAEIETAQPIVEAISNYCDTTTAESAIAPELLQLKQELAVVDNSQLSEQLQQLGNVIEQPHQQVAQRQSDEKPKTKVELAPQVFMGSQPDPNLLKAIQNYGPVYKPIGGIWTSPQQSEYGSEWSAFVHKEGMTIAAHKQQLWLVVPKPDLNILVVDSPETLKSLPHLPPRIPGDDVRPLDYEAIASEYDALVIKPQMLRGCMEVASFDIESTIWFGSRGYPFASVEPLALQPIQQQTSQLSVDVSPVDSTRTDLNTEQPSVNETEVSKQYEHWKLVAQALGKPEVYINRVAATAKLVKAGGSIPEKAVTAMQQNFQTYLKTSDDLLSWHKAAQALGKSEQYLEQIRVMAIAFHDPVQPKPLSPKVASTMQQDLQKHDGLQMRQLWQQYSRCVESVSPMLKANAVASAALKDGHAPEMILKILKHDPQLPLIRQRSGEQAVQNHLKISLQSALSKAQRHSSSNQVNISRQHKQDRGFEL